MDALALLYFAKIWKLHVGVRRIGVCGYDPWISTEIISTEKLWIWMGYFISTASLPFT